MQPFSYDISNLIGDVLFCFVLPPDLVGHYLEVSTINSPDEVHVLRYIMTPIYAWSFGQSFRQIQIYWRVTSESVTPPSHLQRTLANGILSVMSCNVTWTTQDNQLGQRLMPW